LWEKFQLDGFQAGLSWITVLRKREEMRREFDGFDPDKLAGWTQRRIERALQNPGIIRSPTKIKAMIGNARVWLDMRERGEDFSHWLWAYVDGQPLDGQLQHWRNVKPKTPLSETIAKDMKKLGFTFCGPVIVYACLQAVGVVNDHEVACPRHRAVQTLGCRPAQSAGRTR
jgi:DNA-3-methyladenine glycosylase I